MFYHRRPKIVITGSGRSGTSTVARVVHQRLNVCMGHILKRGDSLNEKGYFEDWISHSMVQLATKGSFDIQVYLEAMNYQHSKCASWGVKDPWILFFPEGWKLLMAPQLHIICERNTQATVTSWLKVWKLKYHNEKEPTQEVIDHYVKLTEDRHALCEQTKSIWENHLVLNFDEPQKEADILDRIEAKLVVT